MATLDECPSCALEVDTSEEACPYCGYEFPRQKTGFKPAAYLFVVLLLGWALYQLFRLF